MNKLSNLAIAFGLCIGIASCGGSSSSEDDKKGNENEKIKVEAITEVNGPLGEYFTVADRPVTLTKDGSYYNMTVEVVRNDEDFIYSDDICYFPQGKESMASMCGGFGYEILDEEGDVIAKGAPQSSAYGWDDMSLAIRTPKGQSNSITFHIHDLKGTPAKVRITSDLQENINAMAAPAAPAVSESTNDDGASDDEDIEALKKTAEDIYQEAADAYSTVGKIYQAEKEALKMMNEIAF